MNVLIVPRNGERVEVAQHIRVRVRLAHCTKDSRPEMEPGHNCTIRHLEPPLYTRIIILGTVEIRFIVRVYRDARITAVDVRIEIEE